MTPTIFAGDRARAARARSRKPSSTSGTTSSGASAAKRSRWSAATTASPAPAASAACDEFVAVAVVALDGEERFAGRNRAGVDRDAGHGRRQRARARGAHRLRHRLDGPERPIAHATLPSSAARDRLVVAERQHLFADDLAGFMALAGDQQHVAAAQAPRSSARSPRGDRRSRSRPAPPRGSRRGSPPAPRCADCRR